MRALTRDSGKEVSVLNGDFERGNDGFKPEHVWRLCDWTAAGEQTLRQAPSLRADLLGVASARASARNIRFNSKLRLNKTPGLCLEVLLLAAA